MGVDLIEALGPAHALPPRLGESDRLFVVDNRVVAIADAPAVGRADGGKLNILGEQVIGPAAVLPDHIGGDEEAGARNVGSCCPAASGGS